LRGHHLAHSALGAHPDFDGAFFKRLILCLPGVELHLCRPVEDGFDFVDASSLSDGAPCCLIKNEG